MIKLILNLIFPVHCLSCEKNGYFLCKNCKEKLLLSENSHKFDFNSLKIKYFDQILFCFSYNENQIARKLIIRFKYKFTRELNGILSDFLISLIKSNFNKSISGLLIPVPIHKSKMKIRGFNQSKLLAKKIANEFKNLDFVDGLIRKKFTQDQAKLNRHKRLKNLSGSIEMNKKFSKLINEKFIFLIDDVSTTGSTLNECSKILKLNGAKYICGLVLARGG